LEGFKVGVGDGDGEGVVLGAGNERDGMAGEEEKEKRAQGLHPDVF